jgi:hypothetical protein
MHRERGPFVSLLTNTAASVILIVVGLIYFIATLWIVKFGAGLLGISPDHNFILLAAAIIAAGSMLGSAVQK